MQESLGLYLTILTIPFTQDAGVPGPVPDYPVQPLAQIWFCDPLPQQERYFPGKDSLVSPTGRFRVNSIKIHIFLIYVVVHLC
jgi:hypothetical protein